MEKILSIITPLYNTPKNFLEDLLREIENNTDNVRDLELIFVNDSPSNVELESLLKSIIKEKDYIKVVRNSKNLGIMESYKAGFINVQGKYCCILDHDDIFNPEEVLNTIRDNDNLDIIYTNEYKLYGNKKQDFFSKPSYDILSSTMYFYTHHVTAYKSEIVRRILNDNKDIKKYSSIFDIYLYLQYLHEFKGKDMQVKHIQEYNYGWRIHEASTAASLDQKLSGHVERLKTNEEFYLMYGENPIVKLDRNIPYLVETEFFSVYDEFKYPLEVQAFKSWLENVNNKNGKYNIQLCGEISNIHEAEFIMRCLKRLPLYYLLAHNISTIYIPFEKEYGKLINESYKKHLYNVPIIMDTNSSILEGLMGIKISLLSENKGHEVIFMVTKEGEY
ncbi:MAG: glycosyltransferase [Clostridiaceae bacterium]|jgi:glycosyltransferase involved in cell wall biosynthesis|nr:glycosyltransferase [Clostridiaceae bacterium]